jgi:hypothetical protein
MSNELIEKSEQVVRLNEGTEFQGLTDLVRQ